MVIFHCQMVVFRETEVQKPLSAGLLHQMMVDLLSFAMRFHRSTENNQLQVVWFCFVISV